MVCEDEAAEEDEKTAAMAAIFSVEESWLKSAHAELTSRLGRNVDLDDHKAIRQVSNRTLDSGETRQRHRFQALHNTTYYAGIDRILNESKAMERNGTVSCSPSPHFCSLHDWKAL